MKRETVVSWCNFTENSGLDLGFKFGFPDFVFHLYSPSKTNKVKNWRFFLVCGCRLSDCDWCFSSLRH